MRISKFLNLKKTQYELNFVDIDVEKDRALFIDPFVIASTPGPLALKINRTMQSYFDQFLYYVRKGDLTKARDLFNYFHEPNETRLGLSKKKAKGNAVGEKLAKEIFDSLIKSKAVKTGLIEHIEDCHIFVENVGKDRVSDLTTNIIKKILIDYTIAQCELHNIGLTEDIPTGHYWDISSLSWKSGRDKALIIKKKRIILVPKSIVSFSKQYTPYKFYNEHVLTYHQNEHLRLGTSLVKERVKSKEKYVTKESIKPTQSNAKDDLADFANKHPDVFKNFRNQSAKNASSLDNEDLDGGVQASQISNFLIQELKSMPEGKKDAYRYHSLIYSCLEFVFYPYLGNPLKEVPLNEGRKRVDISFDNTARSGFFEELHKIHNIPCSYIFFECKNYSKMNNPELDQMRGRLGVNVGQFGIIVCRNHNEASFLKGCKDTLHAGAGWILTLNDSDIINMLTFRGSHHQDKIDQLLQTKLRTLRL